MSYLDYIWPEEFVCKELLEPCDFHDWYKILYQCPKFAKMFIDKYLLVRQLPLPPVLDNKINYDTLLMVCNDTHKFDYNKYIKLSMLYPNITNIYYEKYKDSAYSISQALRYIIIKSLIDQYIIIESMNLKFFPEILLEFVEFVNNIDLLDIILHKYSDILTPNNYINIWQKFKYSNDLLLRYANLGLFSDNISLDSTYYDYNVNFGKYVLYIVIVLGLEIQYTFLKNYGIVTEITHRELYTIMLVVCNLESIGIVMDFKNCIQDKLFLSIIEIVQNNKNVIIALHNNINNNNNTDINPLIDLIMIEYQKN